MFSCNSSRRRLLSSVPTVISYSILAILGGLSWAHACHPDLDTVKPKAQDGRHPFDVLDDAGGHRGEQQLGGIEGVIPALYVRIQDELGGLATR
jgi:hypothetical protein